MASQISIANIIIQETGTYNRQVSRPYEANTSGQSLDLLSRRVEDASRTDPLAKISSGLIAGISGSLITPSASWESELIIPNGWNERRLRYLAEIHVHNNFGTEIYFVQGYTDYPGISMQGSIDPNMVFFINSYLQINRAQDYSGLNSGGFRDTISRAEQVIDGRSHIAVGHNEVYGLRPEDLFTGVHSAYLTQGMTLYDNANIADTRINQANEILSSRRTNAIPSSFLCRTIDNYRQASSIADYGNGQDDIYQRAIQTAYEGSPYENPFIRALSNLQNRPCASSFTLNDLVVLDPTVNERITYQTLHETVRMHSVGDTNDNWADATLITQLATTLTHSVSALMLSSMFVSMGFHITNMTLDRQYQTRLFPNPQSITTSNSIQNHSNFITRLETEIMPDITMNGQMDVDIVVYCDLYGETEIQFSLNGAPHEVFVTPSFSDALMAPVITNNQNNYNTLLTGIEEIINQCAPKANYGLSSAIRTI